MTQENPQNDSNLNNQSIKSKEIASEDTLVQETVAEDIKRNEIPEVEVQTDTDSEEIQIENTLRIFFQSTGLDTLTTILEKRLAILGSDEFTSCIEKPGTYENIVAQAINEYSVEAERILQAIEQLEDKSLFDNKYIKDGKTILSSVMTPRRASGNGRVVTGQDARIEFAIKSGQVKRIPLFNSGFYLDIEAPNLLVLNDFFNEAHSETNQYGREFGASFFFFNDLLIKDAFIKLIMPLIMGSSLKNWNRGGNLLRNIKIVDLKTILTGIAALMFPDGFNFTHACTNPDGTCTHVEEMLIDITKLLRHNFMKLSDEKIEHMTVHSEVTYEKIIAYQKSLDVTKTLNYGNMEFELKIPSLEEYLVFGKKFNANLLKSNFADSTADVYQALVFAYYQIYTPFIQTITLYDNNGNKDISTSDPDVIAHQLSRFQEIDTKRQFVEDMKKYIADSEITQICYPAAPCPKCGYLDEKNGYFTVDPEHAFFILSLKKLTPN